MYYIFLNDTDGCEVFLREQTSCLDLIRDQKYWDLPIYAATAKI